MKLKNKKCFTYRRIASSFEGQFSFTDHPFYIILSAQLGGHWVGDVDINDLPVRMDIDYVKFYERK